MQVQMGNAKKEIILGIGWGVAGYFSWYVSVFIFSFYTHYLVTPSIKFASRLGVKALTTIVTHIVFYFTDYILAGFFAAVLTRWCGFKRSALLIFIFGATIIRYSSSIDTLSAYTDIYPKLPSWVISSFTSDMVYIFILLPLSAWIGTYIGRRRDQRAT